MLRCQVIQVTQFALTADLTGSCNGDSVALKKIVAFLNADVPTSLLFCEMTDGLVQVV